MFNSGEMLFHGDGIDKDVDEAFRHYKRAAEHGHDGASRRMAALSVGSVSEHGEPSLSSTLKSPGSSPGGLIDLLGQLMKRRPLPEPPI
jgi:TPR repeat protein